ncbi:MAG: manganese efflux pump [Paludibacteraceae bacterium]|nr:manganese efflux pump [Paludibacteraceae bacterium]
MDVISVIVLAIGLAMDCFAISTVKGVQAGGAKSWAWWALLMALLFGLFQGGMPLIGYAAGSLFASFIDRYDHWIALILLAIIGGKMIIESRHNDDEQPSHSGAVFSLQELLVLSVATSIDALATGIIFTPYAWKEVLLYVAIIGLVSVFFSRLGYRIGQAAGRRLHINVELFGGLVLIGIGIKIFVEGMGWI